VKAYRLHDFTGLDDLKLREEDTPHPQQGEVLVRVHAVSLNFRDIAMLRDRYPLPHRKGLIPTSDGAGEVVEVGAGVDDLKVGDRIMGSSIRGGMAAGFRRTSADLATAVRSMVGWSSGRSSAKKRSCAFPITFPARRRPRCLVRL
jgi:NADPH:quinone reductase-like Zn-dependent oxidoreductase